MLVDASIAGGKITSPMRSLTLDYSNTRNDNRLLSHRCSNAFTQKELTTISTQNHR